MNEHRVKTSMSVMEMGKLLGIGKTDAYWLRAVQHDVPVR